MLTAALGRLIRVVRVVMSEVWVYFKFVPKTWYSGVINPIPTFRGLGDRVIGLILAMAISVPLILFAAFVANLIGIPDLAIRLVVASVVSVVVALIVSFIGAFSVPAERMV